LDSLEVEISIVVPCYNEGRILAESYRRISKAISKLELRHEIIFANDGSTDNTLEIIKTIAGSDPRVSYVTYEINRGAGYAHRKLYEKAGGRKILLVEADLAIAPEDCFPKFIEELRSTDVVVGSRYIGLPPDYPFYRKSLSKTYAFIVRLLFGLRMADTQSGFLGIKKEVIESFELTSDRWEILVELFYRAKKANFKIKEIPLKFIHQIESGQTNMLTEGPRLLFGMIKLRCKLALGK